MRIFLLFHILFVFIATSHTQVFPKDTLQRGPATNRINFVYLSDGYLASELPTFNTDANTINNQLFLTPPFREYAPYFNVYAVRVPSGASGAKHANNAPDCPAGGTHPVSNPLNFFGSKFDAFGIHRLVVADSLSKMQLVLAQNVPAYHQAILIVNSTFYGGSGGWLATTTKNTSAMEIAIHELGHSFAGLADEYWAGAQYASEKPNMTRDANPATVKWKNWVGTNNVGVFPYAVDPSWYRPVTGSRCKMEVLGVPFCSVCQDAITERIHQLVKPIDAFTPAATTLTANNNQQGFKLNLIAPQPNTLKVTWKLNGTNVALNVDTITLSAAQIGSGTHVITATVIDTTSLTRSDVHATAHAHVVQWNINTATRIISPEIYAARLKIYPNPFNEELIIAYDLPKRADVAIEVFNLTGQRLKIVEKKKQEPGKYQMPLQFSDIVIPDGVYFIRFSINGNSVIEEKIKLKK